MLFKINGKESVYDTNPELKAIPEFLDLSEKQMRYVILAYDYKSPLRTLPSERKKEQAALKAGYTLDHQGKRLNTNARHIIAGKQRKVNAAVKAYLEIQFDEDRDLLDALSTQINDIKELARRQDKDISDLEKSVRLSKQLKDLIIQRTEIAEILDLRDEMEKQEEEDIVEDSELSTLDKFNLEQ